jgi:hypothetical protein
VLRRLSCTVAGWVPLTWLGVALAFPVRLWPPTPLAWWLWTYARDRQDGVLIGLTAVGLVLVGLGAVLVTATALWLRLRPGRPTSPEALVLPAAGPVETGFTLGWCHLNPLVHIEVSWEKPDGVEVEMTRRGAALMETVTGSLRGLEQEVVRRVRVVDVLGICAVTFRQRLVRTVAAVVSLVLIFSAALMLGRARRVDWLVGGASGATSKASDNPSGMPEEDLDFRDRDSSRPPTPRPVALVVFHDDYNPVEGSYYFRHKVYSQLLANRLTQTTLAGANPDIPLDLPGRRVEMSLPRIPREQLQKVGTTVCMLEPLRFPIALVTAAAMEPRPNPNPRRFKQVYGVESLCLNSVRIDGPGASPYRRLIPLRSGDPGWSNEVRRHYLDAPTDRRYADLAERIIREAVQKQGVSARLARSPLVQAVLFMQWIRKNTTYSLRPGHDNTADPTAEFLFGNRKGYCQHVASAMTFLLRTRGVSARVAGGFCVPQNRRGQGSTFLVQDRDGHAWCEMYLDGAGWVILDTSPERSEEPPVPEPSREMTNAVREEFKQQATQPPREQKPRSRWALGLPWWLLPSGAAVAALAVLYGIKACRRLGPWLARHTRLYRACYVATLDRLAEVGLIRRFGETREEFARRVAPLVPEFEVLTAGHMRRAVGGRDDLDSAGWHELHRRARRRIAELFSPLRRWMGLLNPISWVRAR